MAEEKELTLFDKEDLVHWKEHWQNMPEFEQQDLTPQQQIIVSFANEADRKAFAKLIDQNITYKTQSIWYPKADIETIFDKIYVDKEREKEQIKNYRESRKGLGDRKKQNTNLQPDQTDHSLDWFEDTFEDAPQDDMPQEVYQEGLAVDLSDDLLL